MILSTKVDKQRQGGPNGAQIDSQENKSLQINQLSGRGREIRTFDTASHVPPRHLENQQYQTLTRHPDFFDAVLCPNLTPNGAQMGPAGLFHSLTICKLRTGPSPSGSITFLTDQATLALRAGWRTDGR